MNFRNLTIYLTWKCNSRCTTCSLWKTKPSYPDISIENIHRIKRIKFLSKLHRIYLTGGEPTTHKDFLEIINMLSDSAEELKFTTNGIDYKIIEQAIKLAFMKKNIIIEFSVNGFEKMHNHTRGIDNYKNIFDLLLLAKRHFVKTSVSFTVFPFNVDEFLPFYEYVKDKTDDVYLTICRRASRYNNASNKQLEWNISITNKLFASIKALNDKYNDKFYIHEQFVKEFMLHKKDKFECKVFDRTIVLNSNGDFYPCDDVRISIGNICDSEDKLVKNIAKYRKMIHNNMCYPCDNTCGLVSSLK